MVLLTRLMRVPRTSVEWLSFVESEILFPQYLLDGYLELLCPCRMTPCAYCSGSLCCPLQIGGVDMVEQQSSFRERFAEALSLQVAVRGQGGVFNPSTVSCQVVV